MSNSQYIESILKAIVFPALAMIFFAYIPHRTIKSEDHTVIAAIGNIRYIGPILIFSGIIGYLMYFRNFISEAKGSPIFRDSQRLIVKGLYRHVRNPMYISAYLFFLGEALYFKSLEMLFYLFAWFVFLSIMVLFVEEPFLRERFGEEYLRYCNSVPRWIPRLRQYESTHENEVMESKTISSKRQD